MEETVNETAQPKKQTERIFELDFLRGILIIGMIWDHLYSCWKHYYWLFEWHKMSFFSSINNFFFGEFTTSIMNWWYPMNYFGIICFATMQGITLTFSRKNKERAAGILVGFMIYNGLFLLEIMFSSIRFLSFLSFEVFLGYAVCMFIFIYVTKLSFNKQILISGLLFIASAVSIAFDINITFNPLHWFNTINRLLGAWAFKVYVFPFIFIFSFGTIIGQLYYKNKRSPFNLYKLNNKKILKPVLWFGRYSLRIFVIQMLLIPLMFFILYLIF